MLLLSCHLYPEKFSVLRTCLFQEHVLVYIFMRGDLAELALHR